MIRLENPDSDELKLNQVSLFDEVQPKFIEFDCDDSKEIETLDVRLSIEEVQEASDWEISHSSILKAHDGFVYMMEHIP